MSLVHYTTPYKQHYFAKRLWWFYFYELKSAWRLGDSVSLEYKAIGGRRRSIFAFRDIIKRQGIFENKYQASLRAKANWEKFERMTSTPKREGE